MATVTGMTVVKQMTYRGQTEEFSNTYHFKSPPPGSTANWDALRQQVCIFESHIFPSSVTFVRVYGYDSNDPGAHHVYAFQFPPPGAGALTGDLVPAAGTHLMAGDQAYCVQWKTDALSSRGKPLYLRKYVHHGFVDNANTDQIDSTTYLSKLTTFATDMQTTYGGMRSATRDLNVTGHVLGPYVTTRTLKHRGKKGGRG